MKNVKWCQFSHHFGPDPLLNLCISLACLNAKELGKLEEYYALLFSKEVHLRTACRRRQSQGKRNKTFTLQLRIKGLRGSIRKDYNEIISQYKWSLDILHISNALFQSLSSSLCPVMEIYTYVYIVVQLLSHVWFFVTPWTAALRACLYFTISWGLLKLMPTEPVISDIYLYIKNRIKYDSAWEKSEMHRTDQKASLKKDLTQKKIVMIQVRDRCCKNLLCANNSQCSHVYVSPSTFQINDNNLIPTGKCSRQRSYL